MRRLTVLLVLAACGGKTTSPDAGPMIDTSCGIDCAAQARFGLIAGTCFEYTDTMTPAAPPSLTAVVEMKRELEGGIPVMDVTYAQGGNRRMQDSFTVVNGELKLVRRGFGTGGVSVSYKSSAGALEGVRWLGASTGVGETLTTSTNADVTTTPRVNEATMYRVTTSAPGTADLVTPYATFDGGLRLLISESPTDHGSDTRRVFVPNVGFTLITTPLMLSGGTSQEYRLQNVKNTADAGACGF